MSKNNRIIIVDDCERSLAIYRRLFESLPASIYATANAEEALRVALYSPPDILLTDLVHPGLSGPELVKSLRKSERTSGVRVWIISGDVSRMSKKELEELDVDLVCEKPVSFDSLLEQAEKIFKSDRQKYALLDLGAETPDMDYKLALDLSSKEGRASLAKDVIAFANFGGGKIFVGVNEPQKGVFEQVGINEKDAEKYEVTNLNKAISPYIDPAHHVSTHRLYRGRKCFIMVSIPGVKVTPLLARKENAAAGLFHARIYTRTSCAESKEITRNEEIRQIMERIARR